MQKIIQILVLLLTTNTILFANFTPQFLEEDDAFKSNAYISKDNIVVDIILGKDIYLYAQKVKVSIKDNTNVKLGNFALPASIEHHGEKVYFKKLSFLVPIIASSNENFTFSLFYQGCSEAGICYQPIEKNFELLSLATSKETISSQTQTQTQTQTESIEDILKDGNIFWIILAFLGFGLLLSLTPCVFPMIPILSGIIVSAGDNMSVKRAFMLSLTYVLAMSITYTIAGVLAGIFGANLQIAFQTPWILYSFGAIFVLLSLSMFGFYNLEVPQSLQTKLTKLTNNSGGSYIGVAIMGLLSALIVGPCVAAPLAGALIYIGQTGDAVLGGIALFSLSMGMGIPLIIVGTSAGKYMPKPGLWMDITKAVFGVMLLGVAIWMISRVIEDNITLLLWSLLLMGSSIYLKALEPLKESSTGLETFRKFLSIILFIYSLLMFVGAIAGAKHITKPLEPFIAKTNGSILSVQEKPLFKVIHTEDELENIIYEDPSKMVMLDFYADWCESCKEYEEITFADPQVQKKLKNFILLQADVTANSDQEKALMKRFNIIGPPAILFFSKEGKEIKDRRLIGYNDPQSFLNHIKPLTLLK